MVRKTSLSILFAWFVVTAFSQDAPEKKSQTYVGIQVNQLIRQIFNFSGSSPAINNPYLLTFAANSRETGWGLNLGWGFNFNEFNQGDAFSTVKTTTNDLFFRMGFERKSEFAKNWVISSGLDVVVDFQNNTTRTKTNTGGGQGLEGKTENRSTGVGLGPRVTLNYNIGQRMMVGTEATYYFKSINNTIESSGDLQGSDETTENLKRFQLLPPTVIYFILKF
jgi:hypothetical protein